MASDILIYDADVVPTGIDQKQHVELARDIAIRFNKRYGETFKIPNPVIDKDESKIYDLQNPNVKMSKTSENEKGYITLLEDVSSARKKIMSAKTDSSNEVLYDRENKPGISNLITIYSSIENLTIKEVEEKFNGKSYKEFKEAVADSVCNLLESIQNKYNKIDSEKVNSVLDKSNKKVHKLAEEKTKDVFKKVGLGR